MTAPPPDPATPDPAPPVRPGVATAFATVGFVALLIAGFGLVSLMADAEVVSVPGLGAVPGAVAVAVATGAFAVSTWGNVRSVRPSYPASLIGVASSFLGYVAGLWFGGVVSGAGFARATAAVSGFATGVFALVLVIGAAVAAWGAVALVRTHARRPQWPWEGEDEEP